MHSFGLISGRICATPNLVFMPTRTWIVLAVGLFVTLGAAMSLKSGNDKPVVDVNQALVASTDIPAGSFVRSDSQLAYVPWPKENISASMMTPSNSKASDFNGAVARRMITKGEPILKNMVVRSSEGGFMAAVLEPGKRAVSIAVDSTSGNAGFIFPGDRVDLILTHSVTRDGSSLRSSETFIQDARVLAVDQMLDNPDNKAVLAKTVTLEVTPQQAEAINLAKDLGKISLSLRSLAKKPDAAAATPAGPETLDDVLKEQLPPTDAASTAAAGAEDAARMTRDTDVSKITQDSVGATVRVIRGDKVEDVQFGSQSGGQHANVPQ